MSTITLLCFFLISYSCTCRAGMGSLTADSMCGHAAPVNFRRAYTILGKTSDVPSYASQMISCDIQNRTVFSFKKTLPLDSSENSDDVWELFIAFTGYMSIVVDEKISYDSLFPYDTSLVLYRFLLNAYPNTVQIILQGGPTATRFTIPAIYKPAIYKSTQTTTSSLVGTIFFIVVFLGFLFFMQQVKAKE